MALGNLKYICHIVHEGKSQPKSRAGPSYFIIRFWGVRPKNYKTGLLVGAPTRTSHIASHIASRLDVQLPHCPEGRGDALCVFMGSVSRRFVWRAPSMIWWLQEIVHKWFHLNRDRWGWHLAGCMHQYRSCGTQFMGQSPGDCVGLGCVSTCG